MNPPILRALLFLRGVGLRRAVRRPTTYIWIALLLVAVICVQQYIGLGAVSTAARPNAGQTGLALLSFACFGLVTAGFFGPVLTVTPYEAQWLVTAPSAASSLIAWRLGLALLGTLFDLVVLTVVAQFLREGSIDLVTALTLGIWLSGVNVFLTAVRYGAAAWFEHRRFRHLIRLGLAGVSAAILWSLPHSSSFLHFIGRPTSGDSLRGFLSASLWIALAVVASLIAVSQAERLVIRAVAAGEPRNHSVFSLRTGRTRTSQPDSFVLRSPGAFVWSAITLRRRTLVRSGITLLIMFGIAAGVSFVVPEWAALVSLLPLVLYFFSVTGPAEPSPPGADVRLLPIAPHVVLATRLAITTELAAELLVAPLLGMWVLGGGTSDQRWTYLALLLPAAFFVAACGLCSRGYDRLPQDQSRLVRAIGVSVLAGTSALLLSGAPHGVVDAVVLLVSSGVALLLWYELGQRRLMRSTSILPKAVVAR